MRGFQLSQTSMFLAFELNKISLFIKLHRGCKEIKQQVFAKYYAYAPAVGPYGEGTNPFDLKINYGSLFSLA